MKMFENVPAMLYAQPPIKPIGVGLQLVEFDWVANSTFDDLTAIVTASVCTTSMPAFCRSFSALNVSNGTAILSFLDSYCSDSYGIRWCKFIQRQLRCKGFHDNFELTDI